MNAAPPVYKIGRLRDDNGNRRELVLVDFQDEAIAEQLLADTRYSHELHADLKAALSSFSRLEKRILFRVLVQGQSVRKATERMKHTSRQWERWLTHKALPFLRKKLSAYAEEMARVGMKIPEALPAEEAPEADTPTVKCKFCLFTSEGGRAFALLRSHCRDEHRDTYKQVHKYVSAKDYAMSRDAELLIELPVPETVKEMVGAL